MSKKEMTAPERVPEKGFYYHYKHTPDSVNNYAYEVVGIGHHTEDDAREIDTHLVVYRPIYKEAGVYRFGKMFDVRPLSMFLEEVRKDGKTFPRFQKISDPAILSKLETIRKEMYGE